MNPAEVLVSVRKYDRSLHWRHAMVRLGEDEHGIWLGAPVGTVYSKGAEGPVYATQEPRVMLFPRDAWWTALFLAAPAQVDVYCDVTTPSEWLHPGEVTMVDLDLDVCRMRERGTVVVGDEDEFADHRVRYGYPPDVIAHATASADWLKTALRTGVEPFISHYRRWLDMIS
jgi:protein associated with RNAse G/E